MRKLSRPDSLDIFYVGPSFEQGPLPALFYFALAGDESLQLAPYNGPVEHLKHLPIRLISLTLPGHGPGFDKFVALNYWAEQLQQGNDILTPFLEQAAQTILGLIDSQVIDPNHLGFAGLSRGAWIAMQLASLIPSVSHILGFAPMTALSSMTYFQNQDVSKWDAHHLVDKLDHVKSIRLYMGNRDTLVGTWQAFSLLTHFVEHDHTKRIKRSVELFFYPSIGKGGHGTPSNIFEEGAYWMQNHCLIGSKG